jgi:hypothetical protein|tara:strand:+ start:827 stop:1165 length:339 start_codon:yes stop_codon:yes gene_type:complete
MAITKTFDTAVPYVSGGKVVEWQLGSTYVNGVSGTSKYYVSEFSTTIRSSAVTGLSSDFTPKREDLWTRAQLEAFLPTGQWDAVFASQVDSVITNPPEKPVPDNSYVIPEES